MTEERKGAGENLSNRLLLFSCLAVDKSCRMHISASIYARTEAVNCSVLI